MIIEMKEVRTVANISDSDDTSVEAFDAPFAGYLDVSGCYAEWTEGTGSQTSTQGVISIEVGGNEVATLTASQSGSAGDTQTFTVDGTYATAGNPHVQIEAGDVIEVKVKTQADGGADDGEAVVHLAISWGV
jgi:hypothetical protein